MPFGREYKKSSPLSSINKKKPIIMAKNAVREMPSFSSVDPFKINSIGIHLTNRCSLECKHCGASSGPNGRKGPELVWIIRFIEKLANNNFKALMITGGEPFLRYNDLLIIIKKCSECGIITDVVSNGFWGNRLNIVEKYIRQLSEAGLKTLTLSVDKIHQKHISKNKIRNIGLSLQKNNWPIALRIYGLENYFGEHEFLNHLEEELNYRLKIFSQPILPVGRAKRNQNKLIIKRQRLTEKDNHPCHMVLFPYIDTNKNWYLCSNGATIGPKSKLCIGKLEQITQFDNFLLKHINSNIFRFMKSIGPIELFNAIGIDFSTAKYTSVCEFCLNNFRNKEINNLINKFVASNNISKTLNSIDNYLKNVK